MDVWCSFLQSPPCRLKILRSGLDINLTVTDASEFFFDSSKGVYDDSSQWVY
jgi:hypothetical protein